MNDETAPIEYELTEAGRALLAERKEEGNGHG